MSYSERLDILEQGDVIENSTRILTERAIEEIDVEYKIDWSIESSMMFVTHLAMAIKRMVEGNSLTDIPNEVKDELKKEEILITRLTEITNALIKAEKAKVTEEEIILIASYIKIISRREMS